MHQCLAAAACEGNFDALKMLLGEENPQGSTAGEASAAQQLMEGVTAEGDTALHLVAANGEENNFKECASLINTRHSDLPTAQNNKGDTALHSAARAGKHGMVSHLIDLATTARKDQELLRTMNHCQETALHEAVRVGDAEIVWHLLTADGYLARIPEPKDGTSPLYLAILLGADNIANTLAQNSSGSKVLNALHAAVLRGSGTVPTALVVYNNYRLRTPPS